MSSPSVCSVSAWASAVAISAAVAAKVAGISSGCDSIAAVPMLAFRRS
jgi:hypothetical protein